MRLPCTKAGTPICGGEGGGSLPCPDSVATVWTGLSALPPGWTGQPEIGLDAAGIFNNYPTPSSQVKAELRGLTVPIEVVTMWSEFHVEHHAQYEGDRVEHIVRNAGLSAYINTRIDMVSDIPNISTEITLPDSTYRRIESPFPGLTTLDGLVSATLNAPHGQLTHEIYDRDNNWALLDSQETTFPPTEGFTWNWEQLLISNDGLSIVPGTARVKFTEVDPCNAPSTTLNAFRRQRQRASSTRQRVGV